MEPNKLVKSYENELAAFRIHFEYTMQRQEIEDIHELRVAIKNIRALLTLTEIASKGIFTGKSHSKIYSSLFKQAGKVREDQINRELTGGLEKDNLTFYSQYLDKRQEHNIQKLLAEAKMFDFSSLESDSDRVMIAMNALPEEVLIHEADDYISRKLKRINKLTEKNHNEDRLHRVRRLIKSATEIMSLRILLNEEKDLVRVHHNLKTIYKKIGDWHDHTVWLESMKKYARQESNKKNSDTDLKNVLTRTNRQNNQKMKKIYGLMD